MCPQRCDQVRPAQLETIILSVIVMLVTGTGDKVVYCLGRSKGRLRTPTSCGGPIPGRCGDRSLMQGTVIVGGVLILLGKAHRKLCKRKCWLEKSGEEHGKMIKLDTLDDPITNEQLQRLKSTSTLNNLQ